VRTSAKLNGTTCAKNSQAQEKERYDDADAGITPQMIARAVRVWLFLVDSPADNWEWAKSTVMGEWIRIPWREIDTPEGYLKREGRRGTYQHIAKCCHASLDAGRF
jgi:hypothetical protein